MVAAVGYLSGEPSKCANLPCPCLTRAAWAEIALEQTEGELAETL